MRAMLLDQPRAPLRSAEVRCPIPGARQVLLRVSACAVCRTDLHIADGELTEPKLPLILGRAARIPSLVRWPCAKPSRA